MSREQCTKCSTELEPVSHEQFQTLECPKCNLEYNINKALSELFFHAHECGVLKSMPREVPVIRKTSATIKLEFLKLLKHTGDCKTDMHLDRIKEKL